MTSAGQTTRILEDLGRGDPSAAERLMPLVYDELRAVAARYMAGERPSHTLQATALIHEVYLRLIGQSSVDWKGRAHFFAVAAGMIRRILIDHGRRHRAAKRGRDGQRVELGGLIASDAPPDVDVLALDEALEKLSRLSERQARIVELRFFGGLSVEETAHVLSVSPQTVKADWAMAKAWLRQCLNR